MFKVGRGSSKEISLVQGEEQRLRFAGAAKKRYPMSKVRNSSSEETPAIQIKINPSKMVGAERGHQRADRLKPQSQTTGQSDHMDHSLV